MGNASSVEAEEGTHVRMKEELAEMHRSLQALSVRCRPPPLLLPDQILVHGVIVNTQKDVQVMLGPVIGKVEFQRARILLEVNRRATVTAHVSTMDGVTNSMVELPQHQLAVQCEANRPSAFVLERLVPGKKYTITFGGIRSEDVSTKCGNLCTQSLEHGNKLNAAVVSGDNFYEIESGERSLWVDVKKRVEQGETQVVLHLGGQVAMERMFDQAVQLLLLYADGLSSYDLGKVEWPAMEARAMGVLRSAYRSQWTLSPDLQFVLANTSNLMMWSDADIYPNFSTREEFFIDHEQPTLRMQIIRTVTRCARRLFHEYQRQLWDDDIKQLSEREAELFAVAEKALASTGQIFVLSKQIPKTADDLELQKKRHEIEGARRVEKLLHAQEAEKARLEKQLISFNQLLAPQRGEEFVFEIGRIAVMVLDLRSSRLEPGGSQARENELLSNLQWRFIEETLERSDIQLLLVGIETPIVEDIPEERSSATATPRVTKTSWSANGSSQARLLSQLFGWKLQQPNRQFIVLSGANSVRCFARMCIKDTKLRTEAEQYTVGAISAMPHASVISRRSGLLHDRYEFEHREDVFNNKCFLTVKLESSQGSQGNIIDVCRVGKDRHDDDLVKVLLGPVIGWVDDSCAVILLEVDRDADIPCLLENPLTLETRRVFQRFYANQANSFFITHLRPGHYYQLSFDRIYRPEQFQASFTTVAVSPRQFDVVALCNESKAVFIPGSLTQANKEPHLWHSVAEQTVEAPFVGLNLTVHLGGHFFSESNDHIHEALLSANNFSCSHDGIFKSVEKEDQATASIVTKFREMYRTTWNMPGIRESFAHGAHLILTNENDQLPINNQDAEDQQNVSVRDLLAKFHVLYQNLLLPPSKRLREGETRSCKPLHHCFGAFGLFVLPIDDFGGSSIHEATWLALKTFLEMPTLSILLLVSTEVLIAESPEDIREKAKVDAAYHRKFGFYEQDVSRLLELLFNWQRVNSADTDTLYQHRKQVVLLSGSHYRSFDSVFREVYNTTSVSMATSFPNPSNPAASFIFQYVVGPLRASEPGRPIPRAEPRQGSLFGRYTYHHSFLRERSPACEEESSALKMTNAATVALGGEEKKRTAGSSATPATNQLMHLLLLNEAELKRDEVPDLDSTKLDTSYGRCSFISHDPIEFERSPEDEQLDKISSRDKRVFFCRAGGDESSTWQLATVLPAWLQKILAQPTTEAEENQVKERTAYLLEQENDVQAAFQRSSALSNGLIPLSSLKHCSAALTESFTMAHRLGGGDFRVKFRRAPTRFVVAFTLQQLQKPESAFEQLPCIGAIEIEHYVLIFQQSFLNSWLISERLENFWA